MATIGLRIFGGTRIDPIHPIQTSSYLKAQIGAARSRRAHAPLNVVITEGIQNAAPCHCMQRSFLLRLNFNGKQSHANQQ
jgi:hypothetical protein